MALAYDAYTLIGKVAKLRLVVVDYLWTACADMAPPCDHESACSREDPDPLCRAWRALGYGKHWPGWAKAEDRLPTRDHGRRGIR